MPSGNLFIRSDYGVVLPGYIQMEPILLGYIPLFHMIEEAIDAGLNPGQALIGRCHGLDNVGRKHGYILLDAPVYNPVQLL